MPFVLDSNGKQKAMDQSLGSCVWWDLDAWRAISWRSFCGIPLSVGDGSGGFSITYALVWNK